MRLKKCGQESLATSDICIKTRCTRGEQTSAQRIRICRPIFIIDISLNSSLQSLSNNILIYIAGQILRKLINRISGQIFNRILEYWKFDIVESEFKAISIINIGRRIRMRQAEVCSPRVHLVLYGNVYQILGCSCFLVIRF